MECNIENERRGNTNSYLSREKEICSKLKKGKLKTKKLIRILGILMNKSPQYNQQSKSEVEEICIYQNMESGRHSIYI